MDVILQGLVGLLLAALEVPRVPRMDIRPLEVPNEDPLEVRIVVDAVHVGGIRAKIEHVPLCR